MHQGNLHTRSSGISSTVTSSSSRTSSLSHFVFSRPSFSLSSCSSFFLFSCCSSFFSLLDAIVTRLCADRARARVSSSSFLFRFPQKPCPFDRFESQRELYLAVRQASRGTNRSHSPRGTIEAAPFKLLVPSETLEYAATLTIKRATVERSKRRQSRYSRENQSQIIRGKTAPDGINSACGLGGISIVTL